MKTRVTLTKRMLLKALPLCDGHLTIRECAREDDEIPKLGFLLMELKRNEQKRA